MEDPEAYLGRLKPIYLFKGLTDEQIVEVARELEIERFAAGEVVFSEKDEGTNFYIINQGRVTVVRQGSGREAKEVGTLVAGDFFGETSLLYARRRSATIVAETDVELLALSKENFDRLLHRFPQMRPNLLLSVESREIYRRNKFTWLAPKEVIYFVARRHKWLMYQSLVPPVLAGLVIALAGAWLAVLQNALWIAWVAAALELPVTLWLVYNYIDWTNDFYIVTNQRLVYLEKIVGIYDSRQEAPLASIMSVNVQTADSIQRSVGMGDVIVRTYSGPITLKSVANPNVLAAAIEEHWYRTRVREKEGQREANRRQLRDRLENGPPKVKPSKPPPPRTAPKGKPLLQSLAEFFSFRVRFEEGDTVTYRKHWFLLLVDTWKPVLGMLVVLVLLTLAAAGFLPDAIPLYAAVVLLVVAWLPLAGWWLYEFIDWKNDIYMVTADQIFDVNKKPLGAEVKKSAPLANVLSLKYERPGLVGVLLNFGNVVALVAGSEFRFDGVFDPVAVQNDIYRRQEAQKAKKQAAEDARLRDEMVNWLEDYTLERERLANAQRQPRPNGAPPAGSP